MVASMSLAATIVDPLVGPVPAGWDEFVEAHQLFPGWYSEPLRALDWCVPVTSSMVTVAEQGGSSPLALFHVRHFGLTSPLRLSRFVPPGRRPRLTVAECRTAPIPLQAGLAFAAGTDLPDRIEAVRAFERLLRRRTGAIGIVYRRLTHQQLALVDGIGRRRRPQPPVLVIDNQWSDLPSYLKSLPRKWRSQLKKLHRLIDADPDLQVALVDTIDPTEAAWLAEVVRLRYTPPRPPRPPLTGHTIAALGRLPGLRFLTYRDGADRLLAYSVVYDNGADLLLIWWGARGYTDGHRRDLYFDQYLRLVELMTTLGRRRAILGAGMEKIKLRYGARLEPRWTVIGPTAGAGRRLGGRPAAGSGAVPAATTPPDGPAGPRYWLPTPRGRRPDVGGLIECCQCGGSASVNVVRLTGRTVRYWCQRCGAVVTLPGRERPLDQGAAGAGQSG